MSSFYYGKLSRPSTRAQAPEETVSRELAAERAEDRDEKKFLADIAALVPAEVITAHAIIVGYATATDGAGATTITHNGVLGWSALGLVLAAAAMFIIGRGLKNWTQIDFVRLGVPVVALLVWMAFMGTSALTPLGVWLKADHVAIIVAALLVGIVLLVVARRVNPVK